MAITAIIVGAGNSRRMGFDKVSADLLGKPVLLYSIEAFARCEEVAEIIVVTSPKLFGAVRSFHCDKLTAVIEGGAERYLSVWNGIQQVSSEHEFIAVHDGARPLINPTSIAACAEAALRDGAAALAHRVVETLKRSNPGSNTATESVSREDLWAMETPQIFRRELLISAYRAVMAAGQSVTDEVSAVQSLGHSVRLVENLEPNLKITIPADLLLAGAWLNATGAGQKGGEGF